MQSEPFYILGKKFTMITDPKTCKVTLHEVAEADSEKTRNEVQGKSDSRSSKDRQNMDTQN